MPDDWVVPENRALAQRPHLLGLTLSLRLVGAGLYVLGVGWGFGKLVTFYDPFAFEIVARNFRVPRVMVP